MYVLLWYCFFFLDLEGNGGGGEDLFTLEAEITELQRENARVESQMLRLKTDINAMEAHLRQGDKVSNRNRTIMLKAVDLCTYRPGASWLWKHIFIFQIIYNQTTRNSLSKHLSLRKNIPPYEIIIIHW